MSKATIAITADRPTPAYRWRWFVAYHLIKLAARVYNFKVEFYRSE